MADWYYFNSKGEMIGPITPKVLQELVNHGIITRETVLENSEGKTSVAGKVKGLAFPEAAPVAPTAPVTAPVPVATPNTTAPPEAEDPSTEPEGPKRKSYKGMVVAVLVIGLLLSAYIFRDNIASIAPGLAEPMTGYRRGFGDTVLTYKNRSYEGSKWEEVKISQINDRNVTLYRVTAWQENDYWVFTSAGIFRCVNGTWTNPHREQYQTGGCCWLDKNTLLFRATIDTCLLRTDGIKRLSEIHTGGYSDPHFRSNFYYADNGLIYMFDDPGVSSYRPIFKVTFTDVTTLDDKSTKSQKITNEQKEYYVNTDDNTIMDEYPITYLKHRIQIAPGKSIGAVFGILTEFRNGKWYKISEIPYSQAMWLDCSGTTPKNAVIVTDEGRVFIHQFGGSNLEMSVPAPQETTSMDLFRVWGNSINKFWTMDTNGTIWEKSGNDWRIVVRGLRREEVTFKDAWVAPTGKIYAITDKKLYQLK